MTAEALYNNKARNANIWLLLLFFFLYWCFSRKVHLWEIESSWNQVISPNYLVGNVAVEKVVAAVAAAYKTLTPAVVVVGAGP